MTKEFDEIRTLFLAAIELDGLNAQLAYLSEHCGGNQELLEAVEAMLRAHHKSDGFLASNSATEVNPNIRMEELGSMIGPYKLLQKIGDGGMGIVYMAEQTEPVRRRVALKIIKPGMDSRQVIARFEAERQALSLMDHPNIARVLDAGTTTNGLPYFVMELVKGQPITQYCDENHLTPKRRLELFLLVCQAIQHAHQKGIIHRDIKPSNVLVAEYDQQVVPKIIDFGVAKAMSQPLTDKTMFTAFGQIVGTLEYMSPEQARVNQLDVDTRTDVYSLGVLLYELMTGSTPLGREELRSAAWDEILRMIRECEPQRPSLRLSTIDSLPVVAANRQTEPHRLGKLIRGDLDWIIMKSLEKDRNRRYESPGDFAADIERHLKLELIHARPVSFWERRWRWCRRNPLIATLSAVFGLFVIVAFTEITMLWQRANLFAEIAVRERYQAEVERERADEEAILARQKADEAADAADRAAQAVRDADNFLYAARVSLAQRAWDDGQIDEASQLLRSVIPKPDASDLRSFEWHYLTRLCHSHMDEFEIGAPALSDIAYSPDGQYLAASAFGKIHVWSVPERKIVRTFIVSGHAQCVAFSPDGASLVSAIGRGNLEFESQITEWSLQTGQSRTIATCRGSVEQLVFSADGKRLGALILFGPIAMITATESELSLGEIRVFDVQEGTEQLLIRFRPRDPQSLGGRNPANEVPVLGFNFSADGTRILATTPEGITRIWKATDGTEILSESASDSVPKDRPGPKDLRSQDDLRVHGGVADLVAMSPDGWRLAASDSRMIRIWDATGNQESQGLFDSASQASGVSSVALSPDSLSVASVIDGQPPFSPARISIRDRVTGQILFETTTPAAHCSQLQFSSDGRLLAAAFFGDATIIWDAITGRQLHRLEQNGRICTFSPDGGLLATVDESTRTPAVQIWNPQTGAVLHRIELEWYSADLLTFSPDCGKLLAVGRQRWEQPGQWKDDDVIGMIDVKDGRLMSTHAGPDKQITSISCDPRGETVTVATRLAIHILNGDTLAEIRSLSEGALNVVYSPDGRRLVTSMDNQIRVRDVTSLEEVLRLNGASTGLSFDRDGLFLAAGRSMSPANRTNDEAAVRVWDFRPLAEGDVFVREDVAAREDVVVLEDRDERIATGVIRYLFTMGLPDSEIENRVLNDCTLHPDTKQRVIGILRQYQKRKSLYVSP